MDCPVMIDQKANHPMLHSQRYVLKSISPQQKRRHQPARGALREKARP